jgi:hypothetical protein
MNPQVCIHLVSPLLLCSVNLSASRIGTATASVALLLADHPSELQPGQLLRGVFCRLFVIKAGF